MQIKIKVLEDQAALNPLFNGTALQPSSAGVDDEDDDMDMEEGGGGSSSVPKAIRFSSNGDTFATANGVEARCFPVGQEDALAQYMQSLSRPPAASSSGAAGGSVLSDLDIVLHSLDTVRDLHEKCKQLEAENVTLKKKAKHSKSMEAMAVCACVCIH